MASNSNGDSEVVSFYEGKNIFITGGSGFLGICLLEKILRTIPNHGKITLLLRPKKNKNISERFEEIKQNCVFERLREERNIDEAFTNVDIVAGDVGEPNLGLSPNDRTNLTRDTHIIFHSAATLDFNETLKCSIQINLLGTRRVIELAKDCVQLKVLVHVSSAYVNSFRLDTEEILYDINQDADELIRLAEQSGAEELERKLPILLGDHPNSYTLTKQMAEHEVKKAQELFPCTIVRPSMIIGAWKEPIPGWTISKNGPQGFLMGAAKGVIRRLPVSTALVYDYIPVDIVVNQLLVAAQAASKIHAKTVQVYHSTTSTRNPFTWQLMGDKINGLLHDFPLVSAVWYPRLKFLPSVQHYKISAFFVHFLPAFLLDLVTRVAGGRPILIKLHSNVNASLNRLERFIFTEWHFHAKNSQTLAKSLNPVDQERFNIDISKLDWVDYFTDLAKGARIYLNKEPLKNLSKAKAKDNILFYVDIVFKFLFLALIWYSFGKLFSSTTSFIILPMIVYIYKLFL